MAIIPKGKKVLIQVLDDVKGNIGTAYPGLAQTELVLEEDLTLNLQSTFSPVVDSSVSIGATELAKQVSRITERKFGFRVGAGFKELGLNVWTKTDPLTLSLTVGLYMISDARTDVWEPLKELLKIPLPEDLSRSRRGGFGLKAPGPTISTIFPSLGGSSNSKELLLISIGNIIISPAIIERAEPTISKETDQFNYPIWAKIRLDVKTIYTATTNMIDDWGSF